MEVPANLEAGAAESSSAASPTPCRRKRSTSSLSISGEFPIRGHRFEGLLPPLVAAPSFTIRRRAPRLIPLEDYVRDGIMTLAQAATIREAIAAT
jgi:type IV secretion system protein VirB11